ncbi:TetR family transcriptional regulator [Zhihengliuella halotolerans]|uniref:TetR family transcriptional regulator n=2 Tax=Zhihengliuella halotolerans TaxID=370736 RepID=A0A4Q8AAD6_9MICC|nr:TetR family transcriptional regulator [Zhihengliuella halotolerans]
MEHTPVGSVRNAPEGQRSDAGPTDRRAPRMPREQRRAQLLDAAHQVFVVHGYHGAAMDEIAETARVSKPVLYQHFPGKRELYLALLDHHLGILTDAMVTALQSTVDNKERVNAAIRTYFDFIAADHQAYRLIFESDLLNDPEVSDRFETFNARIADEITGVISGDTSLPHAQAVLLGRSLSGMAQVAARSWLEVADDVEQDVASDLVSRLAWRGISRFPKES